MRRRPSLLLLVGALVLAGCRGGGERLDGLDPPPPPSEPTVLLVGDSITGGYYATEPGRSFAALLDVTLAETYGGVDTLAVSGARAFRVAAALERDVDRDYATVVLEVGANDVGTSTLAEWRRGYGRLLDAVAATSPGAQVVCLGPWNRPGPSRPYERVVRELCADSLVLRLSDLYASPGLRGEAGTPTTLGPGDDFHPGDAGHQAIHDRLVNRVFGTG